ncbi:lipoprotein [Mycoplasma mycoides]|uniref:lipoprotein n=1 Tax=Mycoplasma mycoides TaxID=2102 RepID=UPI002FE47440
MKKLLTILGSIGLIATTSVAVIACDDKTPSIKSNEKVENKEKTKSPETPKKEESKKEEKKQEKKAEPAATTTTVPKKEVKAKSDAEIASELTRELFLLMDDSKSKSKNNQLTSSTENILKKTRRKCLKISFSKSYTKKC